MAADELFTRFVSGDEADAAAEFVTNPVKFVGTDTSTSTEVTEPGERDSSWHCKMPLLKTQSGAPGVENSNTTSAGNVSVATTAAASPGPRLVMVSEYVRLLPEVRIKGNTSLVIRKSAGRTMISTAAWSTSTTSGPDGGVPTTLTVFVKSDTTLVAVQT